VSIDSKVGRNRAKFRKVYAYGMNRRPDIREFVDALTETTKSLNFQQIIRDRSFFLINGDVVLTFPTASVRTQYSEENWHTTGSVDYMSVTFPFTFDQVPLLAFRLYPEWVLSSGSNVSYWVTDLTATGFKANFSAPFEGRLTYRAVYTEGTYPVYVERTTGSYAWVAGAETSYVDQSTVTMSFGTLPGVPEEVFSNPIGTSTDPSLNIAQTYADVGTNFLTINFSSPYSGSVDIVAISTVPTGSPQPVYPP
jgi:hypothetical protein